MPRAVATFEVADFATLLRNSGPAGASPDCPRQL